jgi:hypothetical protein
VSSLFRHTISATYPHADEPDMETNGAAAAVKAK